MLTSQDSRTCSGLLSRKKQLAKHFAEPRLDLKAKPLFCFFTPLLWTDAAETVLCWTGKRPAHRWQCHPPHPLSPWPLWWTPALTLLKKTWQAVPTKYCLLGVSTFSGFSVLPVIGCCLVLGQSLFTPHSAHQTWLALVPCILCFVSSPFFFLVWPLHTICLVSTYTLKSKPTVAATEVSLPPVPAQVFFWDGKTGLPWGTTIVSKSCGL